MSRSRFIFPLASLAFALTANAQSAVAIELANLREDVRILQQTVGELRLTVEQLQAENSRLRNENLSAADAAVTLTQLNQAIAALKQSTDATLAEQRRETVELISRQIDRLAKQVERTSVAERPTTAPVAVIFTDDFSKEGVTHTVQTGETLSIIAKKYGASLRDIQNANKISDTSRIQAGQTLFIPNPKR